MTDQDQCIVRMASRKVGTGISIFLLEELGDARLRCAQLKKYLDEAVKLVEKSEHRDHFFEVAGHLIHGIPDTLLRMDKALNAAAMAAAKLDYEEIKDELRPEKVDELERALEEVRVRRVQRRSTKEARTNDALIMSMAAHAFRDVVLPILQHETKEALEQAVVDAMLEFARMRAGNSSPLAAKLNRFKPGDGLSVSEWVDQVEEVMESWFSSMKKSLSTKFASENTMNIKEASARLERLAAKIETLGLVPSADLMGLIAALEAGVKTASSNGEIVEVLRGLSSNLLEWNGEGERPSRTHLARTLRRVLADTMDMTSAQMAAAVYQNANSREEVIKGFRDANPSMTDAQLEEAADHWEKNRNVVKDKSASEGNA